MEKRFTQLLLALMALVVLFSSCKKNDDNYDYRKMPTSVELPIAAYAGPSAYDNGGFKLDIPDTISTTPQSLSTIVLLSTTKTLSKAVTVTLTIDNAALTRLNAAHRALYIKDSLAAVKDSASLPDRTASQYTIYTMLPSNAYAVPNSTVTIPAGLTRGSYIVKLIGANLTLGTNYMLPVTITDAQGQAISYYKSVYYIIDLKSPFEGDYTANGSIAFPTPSSDRSWTSRDKQLTTVNANTIRTEVADLGDSNYFMYLTVNADNSVTVKPAPDGVNQTVQNNGVCTYNPSTKTFTLNYKYVGGTGDRVISETIQRN